MTLCVKRSEKLLKTELRNYGVQSVQDNTRYIAGKGHFLNGIKSCYSIVVFDSTKGVESMDDTSKTKEEKTETQADKIWNMIKDQPIELFALPNQSVKLHVTREAKLERAFPDQVSLILKSAAVLPALEEALGRIRLGKDEDGSPLMFSLTQNSKYTVVKIVPRDV